MTLFAFRSAAFVGDDVFLLEYRYPHKSTRSRSLEMSQPQYSQPQQSQPTCAATPEWLGECAPCGFLVTRSGPVDISMSGADCAALLNACKDMWQKHAKDDVPIANACAKAIPDCNAAIFVALEPANVSTDVAAFGNWIMERLAEGCDWPRPTHVNRMIPVECVSDATMEGIECMAEKVIPKHLSVLTREGTRSSTYETHFDDLSATSELSNAAVNRVVGNKLPSGYQIDLVNPAHTIIIAAAGPCAFMSVVEKYDAHWHYSVHAAMSKAAAA